MMMGGQYGVSGSVIATQHYRSVIYVCVLVKVQNTVQVCIHVWFASTYVHLRWCFPCKLPHGTPRM